VGGEKHLPTISGEFITEKPLSLWVEVTLGFFY